MRILMLNYEFPPLGGGASPVSYEIAKGYVKLGHSVDVVTMSYKNLPFYEVVDGINVYRVPCLRSKKEICHPHEMLTYIISAKRFLKNHLKKNKYDINHTHFIIPTGFVALWLKKNYQLPYIVTSHGSDVIGYNKRFKYFYPFLINNWKKIIKEAKYVTTPSKFLQNEIKKKTNDGNFIVIPNGIDKNKFKPMKKEKKILVVSRFFENKGVQDIIEAVSEKELKQELEKGNWRISIVGDGPYKNFLENKVNQKGLNNLITFKGWLDNNSKEIKELYGKAKIFISASYFESFGLTLLEALQSECYPLVSNIEGHKEILKDDKYFFGKNNTNKLRNKIKITIKSKNLNQKIIINKFYWKNIIERYEEVLE